MMVKPGKVFVIPNTQMVWGRAVHFAIVHNLSMASGTFSLDQTTMVGPSNEREILDVCRVYIGDDALAVVFKLQFSEQITVTLEPTKGAR
jgi:hypothetical protein